MPKNRKRLLNQLVMWHWTILQRGLDPAKTTIFIQSQIPELAELTMYYMNLVSVARLERNPTVKPRLLRKDLAKEFQLVSWSILCLKHGYYSLQGKFCPCWK